MRALLPGEGFRLRRAAAADVEFMARLAAHEEVEPFMAAVSAREREELLEEVLRSEAEPALHGRFVLEVEEAPVGTLAFDVANRRSRIAYLHAIMLEPAHRGRGLATAATRLLVRHLVFELDYHRVQLEVYGFNERALAHFERAGFRREGVRRRAYWRHGDWVDGILFGLVREDLEPQVGSRAMELIHTCYRVTDPDRSVAFYEALGFVERRRLRIRDEAVNIFMGLPGDGDRLELTYNFGVDSYELGTGYGHVAVAVGDLDATLSRLAENGIEPERPPYTVREGGSRICFVRDPDGYRVELIERG